MGDFKGFGVKRKGSYNEHLGKENEMPPRMKGSRMTDDDVKKLDPQVRSAIRHERGKTDPKTPGTKFTKTIEQGPNKGDTVQFKVAPGGKPFPQRVVKDVGSRSTLRDNSGVKFGKGAKKKT